MSSRSPEPILSQETEKDLKEIWTQIANRQG
jgi:hypothetical protein